MWLSYPRLKLIILGIVVIFSLIKITSLRIDYDIKQFFPEDDREIIRYREYIDDFGSDEQLIMIAIEKESGVFNVETLSEIKAFSDSITNIKSVMKVVSLVSLKELVKKPIGFFSIPLIRFSDAESLARDSLRIFNDEKWRNWLFSDDGKTIVLFVETEKDLPNKEKRIIVDELKRNLTDFGFNAVHLAGPLYTEVYYLKMTFFETAKSILTCTLVVIILVVLLFKTFKKIAIIMLTIFLGIILFYGFLGLMNEPLNVLSTLFPTLVVIVAVSDLIHFMTKYEYEIQSAPDVKTALKATLKEISVTLFITSFTTIIGLLAFTTSPIVPIKEFALYGALGVFIAFFMAVFIFPILILLVGVKASSKKKESARWTKLLEKVYWFGKERTPTVVVIFTLVLIVSVIGISRLGMNNKLMGAMMDHSPLKKDFYYFEERLNGARALEITVTLKAPYNNSSMEAIREIEKLQDYLDSKENVGALLSPVNSFKHMNAVYHPGMTDNYRLPESQQEIDLYFNKIVSLPKVVNGDFMQLEKNRARMYGKMKDIGAVEMKQFISETQVWIDTHIDQNIATFKFTGSALLIDKMNLSLVNSMIQSLLIALVLVSLIVVVLFKRFKYIVISLIPNILPLLIVGGVLGFFSIEITGAMALIFTLGFVIAVDDTIHFLSKYKYERAKNTSPELALKNTLMTTGKAIITTSFVLSIGYLSIIISESRESFFHGLLISITLLVALVTDLLLLPVLIRKMDRQTNDAGNDPDPKTARQDGLNTVMNPG